MKRLTVVFLSVFGLLVVGAAGVFTGCNQNNSNYSGSQPTVHVLSAGMWGGQGIILNVTETGGTYELDCGAGTIDQPIAVDTTGHFHNTGTINFQGGPVMASPPPPSPAAFDGTVSGDTMNLTITVTRNGQAAQTNYTLVQNQQGHIVRCL